MSGCVSCESIGEFRVEDIPDDPPARSSAESSFEDDCMGGAPAPASLVSDGGFGSRKEDVPVVVAFASFVPSFGAVCNIANAPVGPFDMTFFACFAISGAA